MARPSYFETGTHHILCKIAGLDPKEFPYPQDFQDCWDHHHVRLACSDRPASAAVTNAWPEIVQGLTTTITNSKQLSDILSRWNEGDPREWNIDALEAFLNVRADRNVPTTATSTSTSTTSSPDRRLRGDADEGFMDDGGDVIMGDRNDHREDGTSTPLKASASRPSVRWDHNEATAEDQFLSREERDRFFNVILPGMQQLALRLPELVKRPIPFLKQQQDSAVTLSQEQLSLFAYFKKAEPKSLPKQESSKPTPPPVTSRHFGNDRDEHRAQERSHNPGANRGDVAEKLEDPSGSAKIEPRRKPQHNRGEEFETRRLAGIGKDKQKPSFPRYPSINFSSLFYSDDIHNPCTSTNAAKLRCIIHYFDRILQRMPSGVVTFHRQVLNETVTLESGEMFNQAPFSYSNVKIELDAPLEDDAPLGALQLDFANKVIGGGVLGRGAVQEEIRFAICPELIVSRLFTQMLQNNEAVLIKGAERFSNYNGYAQTFEWHSDHIDTTPRDKLGRRKTEICAMDALPFKSEPQRLDQFCESTVLRELNKAIAGFRRSPITSSDWGLCRGEVPSPRGDLIATGNWGCGAFGGHLQLKFLIQLIAASVCAGYSRIEEDDDLGRDLIYFTYGLDSLADEIRTFMAYLQASPDVFEPWRLVECIINYPIKSMRGDIVSLRTNKSLLDYISASFGFPNASHGSSLPSTFTDTQEFSTIETSPWSDSENGGDSNTNTPEYASD
ncbi:hypothetical protein BGX24_010407 [Mortierella sp. AD032]|nr:hypothetical protein BGX24_010407 [Mortierella sp. AD032]